jgi:transcriptional regulator with XRE-family HTH domain
MDRDQLADFLRRRREALRPEDVGLPAGPRRRTPGLRREEVAQLASMSADYLTRLEQRRGPQPSSQMLAAIARALRLTVDERDHLFRLAGRTPPSRARRTDHVSPALMRVLDRLDTPALVVSDLGATLAQNELAVALLGEQRRRDGLDRYFVHRWFADPAGRAIHPPEDHDLHGRTLVAALRIAHAADPGDPEAIALIDDLRRTSPEFAARWDEHAVARREGPYRKRIVHPTLGTIAVDCQTLVAENDAQQLLVYTATPGSDDAGKLRMLGVVGRERFDVPAS